MTNKNGLSADSLQTAYGWQMTGNMPLLDEIRTNFIQFTERHIARVNTLASFINDYYPDHDSDKFTFPFYYLLQWRETGHALKELPDSEERLTAMIDRDTWAHVLHNPHHPEHWDKSLSLSQPFERKNPRTNIDATAMTKQYLNEFVCDCMSMSIMLDKNPEKVYDWFDKSVGNGKRWRMTDEQIDYIYATAKYIIGKLKNPKRKVYFDVDGVLRNITGYFGVPDNDWDIQVDGKTIYDMILADFSCLEKMKSTEYVPVVQKFTKSPYIISTQIEQPAKVATAKWLADRFALPQATFVGEGSSAEKVKLLAEDDRIFDDHPKFPESNKLIIVGHGYNRNKPGFRVNTVAEMEGALDVLQAW